MDGDALVAAVRAALAGAGRVREVKMFGGIGFMLDGNLVAAASRRGLLLRVGTANRASALRRGASEMVMRGRPMADYVRLDPAALDGRPIKPWLTLAAAFTRTLPPKPAAKRRRTKGTRA